MKRLTALLISSLLFASFASPTLHAEELPEYQVDLIIFETTALKGWTEEHWSEDIDIIDTEDTITVSSLPENQFMLKEQAAKMTPARGYKILYHQSWILQGKALKNAKPMLIEAHPEKDHESRIEGTMTFYKSRFAHVRLNLELERKIPAKVREKFAQQQNLDEATLPEFWRFNLKEARKVKSKQLHYFDHPIFGAIVKIQYQGNLK